MRLQNSFTGFLVCREFQNQTKQDITQLKKDVTSRSKTTSHTIKTKQWFLDKSVKGNTRGIIAGKSSKCNFIQEISNSGNKKILSCFTKKDREKNINTYIHKEKQKEKERKERKKEQRIMGDRKKTERQRSEEKKALVKTRKKDGKRERMKRTKKKTKKQND